MVPSFMINLFVGFFDPIEISASEEIGAGLLVCGSLFFVYVLLYLRGGFFGETEPKLDFLITRGPHRFCRHPQYLSLIIIVLGFDLMFKSVLRSGFTLTLSIPSAI